VLRSRVMREGAPLEVPAEELVPGDVVLLAAGTLVPADGVLLEGRDLFVNQAVLTGESLPVEKTPGVAAAAAGVSERTHVLFMGTSVRSGTGTMLVVGTGMNTAYGEIAHRLSLRPPETEFERGVRRFGYLLTRIILLLVLVVFAANVFLDRPHVDALLFAIALAVGISPELLPAIISVTLAQGARQMAREGVIVRRLNAIENFGSMDVLCSDKTGTLTEGTLRLHSALDGSGTHCPKVLAVAVANARLQTGMQNPLDEAIVVAAPETTPLAKLDEIPYDFSRRRLTVVVADGAGARLLTKGALGQVLEVCSRVREADRETPLAPERRAGLEADMARWSAGGLRVLGVATRGVPRKDRYGRDEEAGMTFEGFLLFEDRPKQGVDQVLREMRALGVAVKVVTGDNRHVARHVAESVGLDGAEVLTGAEMAGMTDEALWHRARSIAVFAEIDPNQKERIVVALQKTGHVVGYLGDGINDAPALHAADVGISVDTAADVARESADLVLLEHDLEVLRRGILLGRTTFANTLKYVHITTSANFGNMVSMAIASLFLPFLPLLATQILLNNFLSDVPALALAGDRVDAEWVERPRRWEIRPIQRFMIVFGLVSSAFDFLAFGLLLFVFGAGAALFRTAWFVLSLLTELVVIFVVRTRGSVQGSRPSATLAWSAAATGAVALILPFVPVGAAFRLVPLPGAVLAALVLLTLAYGVATEGAKRWFYRKLEPA
jgi:P-type Mg2+ transporter